MVATASALGVAWRVPGSGQQTVDIPPDAFASNDTFEFCLGLAPARGAVQIVHQFAIGGLNDTPPTSPDSILKAALRFVEGIIGAVVNAESVAQ